MSMEGGGPNMGAILSAQGNGVQQGNGWANGAVNPGSAGLTIEGKTAGGTIQRQGGKPWETFLGGIISKLLASINFSTKGIADEIAQMSKSDPGEIVGMTQHAEMVGELPQQAQNFSELVGNSEGMLASAGVTGGIEAGERIVANAPAAAGNQTQIG